MTREERLQQLPSDTRQKVEVLDNLRHILNMSWECDYGVDDTFREVVKIFYKYKFPEMEKYKNRTLELWNTAYTEGYDKGSKGIRMMGEWVCERKQPSWQDRYVCSNCGTEKYFKVGERDNFCPHCGADMRGDSK